MTAPDIDTIAQNPVVVAELEAAWRDSLASDAAHRHEEGGWVYHEPGSGAFQVRRAPVGDQAFIDLYDPPTVEGFFLVATYHTHPNPASEGWLTGPSFSDTDSAFELGVPCIIRAEDGIHTTGPASRRGGLTGPPGFPDPDLPE
jgi:hypothetical protein